jgi:hypothetical protein
LEGSGRGFIEVPASHPPGGIEKALVRYYPRIYLEGLRKTTKTSVRIAADTQRVNYGGHHCVSFFILPSLTPNILLSTS